MNINQALKEKNRLSGKLNKLKTRINNNNSTTTGNEFKYDVKETMEEYSKTSGELIDLKVRISNATQPILEKILLMGEYKTFIDNFKHLSTTEGVVANYSDNKTEYKAQIGEVEKDEIIEQYEDHIAKLQDQIDAFNALTQI